MMRKIALCVTILALTACAAQKVPLEQSDVSALSERTVVTYNTERDSFLALTSGRAAGGALGVIAAANAGNKFVAEAQIADPAQEVEALLSRRLESLYDIEAVAAADRKGGASPEEAVASHPEAHLAMDVNTRGWGYRHDGFDNELYSLFYAANMILRDAESSDLLAKGYCKIDTRDEEEYFEYDRLFADNERVLREFFARAADDCANELVRDYLRGGDAS